MKQGYSGSTVRLIGHLVEKSSSDEEFTRNMDRQKDLIALTRKLTILPRIDHIDSPFIFMDFIEGQEGLDAQNADLVGHALRQLHDQPDYLHPCMTGVEWLVQAANENLAQTSHSFRFDDEFVHRYPSDALILSESDQVIQKPDGSIVFIDIEGMGRGSRYQDIGYIFFRVMSEEKPEILPRFISGYQTDKSSIDMQRVFQMAGLIAVAYAVFADFNTRLSLGFHLLGISA